MHAPADLTTPSTLSAPRWTAADLIRLVACVGLLVALSACGGARPAPQQGTDTTPATAPQARPHASPLDAGADFEALAVVVRHDATGAEGQRARSAFGVHPTLDTAERPNLTWPLRLDRAGFHLAMVALTAGRWPEPAQLRTESFLQAGYELLAGRAGSSAARPGISAVAWPSPHRPGYHLLHLVAHGGGSAPVPLRAVVVLMGGQVLDPAARHRVQRGLGHLVTALGRGDEVMVVGADAEGVRALLPPTSATDRARIGRALERWQPKRPTPPGELARVLAAAPPFAGALGKAVVFAAAPEDDLTQSLELIHEFTKVPPHGADDLGGWAVVGLWSAGGLRIAGDAATRLAAGLGAARLHADTAAELRTVMGEDLPAALRPDLANVRLELRFDARQVQRHRPLGFERLRTPGALSPGGWALERSGAVPAGGALTALFEVKLAAAPAPDRPWVEALLFDGAHTEAVARAPIDRVLAVAEVPLPARLSAWCAAFGEKLAGAWWSRAVSWASLGAELDALRQAAGDTPTLAAVARGLTVARALASDGAQAMQNSEIIDDFDHLPVRTRSADGPR